MGVAGDWNNAVGEFRGRVRSLRGNAPYYSSAWGWALAPSTLTGNPPKCDGWL